MKVPLSSSDRNLLIRLIRRLCRLKSPCRCRRVTVFRGDVHVAPGSSEELGNVVGPARLAAARAW